MRRQAMIAGVASALVAALVFLFLVKPVGGKISSTRKDIETAEQQRSNLQLQLAQLQAAKQNAPAVLAQLAKFDLLLPQTSDLPVFIRQLQKAADDSGIDLSSIAPSPPSAVGPPLSNDPSVAGKGVAAIGVVLQVTGGFFRLQSFMQRLENLQRVVLVQNISITPSVSGVTEQFSLAATITLQMYVINPNLIPVPGTTVLPTPGASGTPSGSASPSPTTTR